MERRKAQADGWFTAACGPMIYHDRALPGYGQYFVCEPAGNLIHRAVIESDGPVLKVRRENGERSPSSRRAPMPGAIP